MLSVQKPTCNLTIKEEMSKVLDSGWWGCGPKVVEFEKKFAEMVGVKYCVATNSGTSALDLCLKAYGIKGGELITTPMTFTSDAIVGEWNGMDVTFADVDEDTLCLDPKAVYPTKKTKAIITVDSHGRLADIKGLRRKFKGLIIEDAAHACLTPGAGLGGDIAMWSFQAVKTLPAGDGGAITTNDEEIAKRIKTLYWVGVEKTTYERNNPQMYSWDYDIQTGDGIKGYMTDLQGVIALNQIPRLEGMNAYRRQLQDWYNEGLKDIPQVKTPLFSYTVQYYTIQCERRDELCKYLADNGIATGVHFKPLSVMTYWKKAIKRPLPVTDRVWPKLLTLPTHPLVSWLDVEKIMDLIKRFYA